MMIVHNAAAVAMVLLALAAAQGRGHDMTGEMTGTMGQGGGGGQTAQPPVMDRHGDIATQYAAVDAMSSERMSEHTAGHAAMSAHMAWSDARPATGTDSERAAQIVKTLQTALARYKDYHVAEADGFRPFHPEFRQVVYHFTRWRNGLKAAFTFDPVEPTSLLYKKTPEGGYKLVGAMYTAPRGTSEAKLDQRVPLSVARWHRHINLCFPPKGQGVSADWTKFGFAGSISSKAACDAAGGRFYPQVFGWMVHVYPWATTQQAAWSH
jgi:hypothetical protein